MVRHGYDAMPPAGAICGLDAVRAELQTALADKVLAMKAMKAKSTAKAKAKGNASAKATPTTKATATPTTKAKAKPKPAPVKGKGKAAKLILGCSKCRYAASGCGTCKDRSFTGKRGRH